MSVSVIIPAYNASATIAQALKALMLQDYPGDLEIIAVDDGSTDETPAMIARFSKVKYLRQDNAGPAAARNCGARAAVGDFLCFTDSDCVPRPDWISGLLKGFNAADIAVVAGSYGIANPSSPLARGIHAEIIYRHAVLMPEYPKAFGSYNFCVRTSVFNQVGGFHAGYRQASGEDNDLSYKILKAGYRIHFQPQVLVDHHHTSAPVKYLKEQFRHGYWRVKMYADHPEMVAGDDYTFWKDILEVVLAGVCAVGLVLGILGFVAMGRVMGFVVLPFLVFEIIFGYVMLRNFLSGIFFGYVMFVRSFFRTAGLSTGIYYFFVQKIKKNLK